MVLENVHTHPKENIGNSKDGEGLKWDPGYGRVGIRAEGVGWCACEFKNLSESENKL